MDKIYCGVCKEYVDKVVLSYSVRTWDEAQQEYVHRKEDGYEEGDWACSKCGTSVMETGFHKPGITYFLRPGSAPPSPPPSCSFPQTFGDWVDIAESIKEKNPSLAPEVNENLGYIFTEDPDQSEEAKRWLVEKAGELGVG